MMSRHKVIVSFTIQNKRVRFAIVMILSEFASWFVLCLQFVRSRTAGH